MIQNLSSYLNNEEFKDLIDLNVPIELRNNDLSDSDDEWYDCIVINKRRKTRNANKNNEVIVELPPHLAYLCLHNNNNFPSIV